MKVLCPQIEKDDIMSELGIDLNDLVDTLAGDFDEMMELVNSQLGLVKNVVDRIDGGMVTFEESVDTADEIMWIVPGLLFAVSMLTAISMLGVLLAWKGKSGVRIQRAMSYFVLPLLIVASIACWIAAIMASFGTMVSSGTFFTTISFGELKSVIGV
jgi:ABC-type multidrug transport system permease subunit